MKTRSSGILMHITSLPSPFGIGTFGKEAYSFVDFLVKAGQSYWQILPLGITGFGDSPYQPFSAFAGNPYFIDFRILMEEGLLNKEDYENLDYGDDSSKVDYQKIFQNKLPVLRIAYENAKEKYKDNIMDFRKENSSWIEDYGLYMSVKSRFDLKSWLEWDEDIKFRKEEALNWYRNELRDEIDYWIFLQYEFFKQWKNLKSYANDKKVKIIGDIPIYVAEDSADTWARGELFLLDEKKRPLVVSGCPPDAFSATGQLWGNPIYNWSYLEKTGYEWWIERIRMNMILYDVIRIDHFRGFEAFWQVPKSETTAVNGKWVKGPGIKLFNALKNALGEVNIIAEDLGYLTQEVIDLRNQTGFPGMKVLEFAFDSREESDYLPHNYTRNSVVYTGTHDNDTVIGWFKNANKHDVDLAIRYFNATSDEGYNWSFIRGALSSVSDLAVVPLQDYLGYGSEARMNIPSTLSGNWQWRLRKEALNDELAEKIYEVTRLYGR